MNKVCFTNMKAESELLRTHTKLGTIVSISNPRAPLGRWEVKTGDPQRLIGQPVWHAEWSTARDLVLHKVEGKDQHLKLSSDPHSHHGTEHTKRQGWGERGGKGVKIFKSVK